MLIVDSRDALIGVIQYLAHHQPGGAGAVSYGEGLFIGYRYYDAKEMPVLFPFGQGLIYTTFAYSNAKVSAKIFKDTDSLTVTVDVTNTG